MQRRLILRYKCLGARPLVFAQLQVVGAQQIDDRSAGAPSRRTAQCDEAIEAGLAENFRLEVQHASLGQHSQVKDLIADCYTNPRR